MTVLLEDHGLPLIWVEDRTRLLRLGVVLRWLVVVLTAGVVIGSMFR